MSGASKTQLPFSNEERLIVLANLVGRTPTEQAEFESLARATTDWAEVASLAKLNAVLPKTYLALCEIGVWTTVPGPVRSPWEDKVQSIRKANEARLQEAGRVMARLHDDGIRVIILKGIYFAEALYGDAGYKKMNDVDFLVERSAVPRLYGLFEQLDYFCVAPLMGDSAEKQEKYSHHMPPFVSRSLNCVLGTHWGLVSPLTPYKLDYEGMWSRAVPFDFQGVPLLALSPEDNLHHLCVHLPYYKTGVRELADIFNLLRVQGNAIDWQRLEADICRAGTGELVYHALSLTNTLVPHDEAEALCRRLEPSVKGFYRKDTRRKLSRPRLIVRSRSTQASKVEKAYAEFSLTEHLGEKAAAYAFMWVSFFLPPVREVAKMNYVPAGSPWVWRYYPTNFVRIARLLAKDLGWKLFWLVTLKEIVDLGACAAQTLRKGFAEGGKEALARRIGLSVRDIDRLKEALE